MSQVRGQPEGLGDFSLLPVAAKQIPSKLSNLEEEHLIPHTPSEGQGSVCFWPSLSRTTTAAPPRQPGLRGPGLLPVSELGGERGPQAQPRNCRRVAAPGHPGELSQQFNPHPRGGPRPLLSRGRHRRGHVAQTDAALQHPSGYPHVRGCAAKWHSTTH